MSSLFNIAAGGQAGFYDYQIEQSLRFDESSQAYLRKTNFSGSPTSEQTGTFSVWVKNTLSYSDNRNAIYGSSTGSAAFTSLSLAGSSQVLDLRKRNTGASDTIDVIGNPAQRDPSAWYHIMSVYDMTNSTRNDRAQIYVNGVRVTDLGTNTLPSNISTTYDSGDFLTDMQIGRTNTNSSNMLYADFILAEYHRVDGQALDPTDFGEFKSGVWVPKEYTGTYGNHGFYLDFADTSDIGKDVSGNGNDFTANNLSAHDVVPDSPTLNYATFNPLINAGSETLSEGNLKFVSGGSNKSYLKTTIGMSSGKYYCEAIFASGSTVSIGLAIEGGTDNDSMGKDDFSWSYESGGTLRHNNTSTSYGDSYSNGDIIGMAFDHSAGTITFFKNNVSQGVYSISGHSSDFTYFFAVGQSSTSSSGTWILNTGQDSTFSGSTTAGGNSDENGYGDFKYAVPSGFLALNSANLPEPSITPLDDDLPEDYFDTVLYTGNGSSGHVIDGIQTNPDFTWIKDRNVAKAHMLFDSLRGDGTNLYPLSSDGTGQERTDLSRLILGDGQFEIDVTESSVNANNQSYVSWNWQAGGTAVSNTDGSVTSSVSVNTKAGFSIATYTEPSGSFSFGHGLGVTPDMFIFKRRNGTENWIVWQKNFGSPTKNGVYLNDDGGQFTTGSNWLTAIDSDTISITSGQVGSAGTKVCYAFKGIEGYSKFGKYTGNGSTNGTFVYTGFRPAFVMIKNTSSSAGWPMYDSVRGTTVGNEPTLNADSAGTESSSGDRIDFNSSGFKLKINQTNVNLSGNIYVYMAFAEMPFKYANAV